MLSIISCTALALGITACKKGGNTVERHKHEYIPTVIEPTCTAKGHTEYNCECGSSFVSDYTDPIGHDYDGDVCKRCGWIKHDHIYEKTTVEATCTEGGYTKGVCTVCGATYTAYYSQPLGHNYENGRCTRCGDGVSGELEYTLSDDGSYYICTGIGTETDADIVIDSVHNGKPVREIGEYAFSDLKNIKSVKIGNNVTVIGKSAFNNCTELVQVEIPDRVITIDEHAFYNCTSLTEIELPDSVTVIGDNAFFQCSRLKSVTMPDSLKFIGIYAFGWCVELTDVTIPRTVQKIDRYAFFNCRALESIVIPDSVAEIGYSAFYGCISLTIYCEAKSAPEGWSVEWNGNRPVIWNCNNLNDDGLEYTLSITGAYYICTGLSSNEYTDVVIASEYNGIPVMAIGDSAFANCGKLTSVVIPDSIYAIGKNAFAYCNNLSSITIPDSVTSIGEEAFYYCMGLTEVKLSGNLTHIPKKAFYYCTRLESLILPDSVTSVGEEAFMYCGRLANLTISVNLTSIGRGAFMYCEKLRHIYYGGTVEQWLSIDKAVNWDLGSGIYTVHCTDDDLDFIF